MFRVLTFLSVLLSAVAVSAQPTWITMQNENFRVYSSATERETRQALNQLERVRGFFIQFLGVVPKRSAPVTVVIFGSEKEYRPYRFNEFATAYYTGAFGRDVIVLGELGEESSRIATHEYTHLLVKESGTELPPWLNEGIAELYSTLRAAGGKTEFGDVIPERLWALNNEPWVPMAVILAADQTSPYYNETKQAGSLYNQGWVMVHMLATKEAYRSKFSDVVRAVRGGTPSAQALETTYGVPLATLESALQSYIRGNSFRKLRVEIKLDAVEKLTGQPADMFEVRATQAALLMALPGKQAEARLRLDELTREEAGRPEPWINLGYLAFAEGKRGEAAGHFTKAFELGSRESPALLTLAGLSLQEKPERAATVLKTLLEADSSNIDARLMMASLQMSQSQFSAALATVRSITAVRTNEQRDQLLYMRAFAALRTGDVAEARARAEELKRVSIAPEIRARAEDLLRILSAR